MKRGQKIKSKVAVCKHCGNLIPNYKCGLRYCKRCKEKGVLKLSDVEKQKRQDKYKKTLQKKYGSDITNVSQLNEIKQKKKQTLRKNYGVDSPLQSEKIKQKVKQTNLQKYGVEYFPQSQIGKISLSKKRNLYDFPYNGKSNLIKQSWCIFCGQQILIYTKKANNLAICDNCYDNGLRIKFDDDFRIERNSKIEKTNLQRYGVRFAVQNQQVRQKIIKTNIERYGVSNVFQSEMIKNKIKQTMIDKYGVENISQSTQKNDKLRTRYIQQRLLKYMKDFNLELLGEYNGSQLDYNFKCLKCGKTFRDNFFRVFQRINHCIYCGVQTRSNAENQIAEFVKSLGINNIILNSRRIIKPKELDIYIPDKQIAIEYNGLYWHSTQSNPDFSPYYHYEKFKSCYEKQIQLIQIFEDEWIFKQDIVKSRIRYLLNVGDNIRIHARKCIIQQITPKQKNQFLEEYHIQGQDRSVVKLGAFYQNELVGVMTFSHGNIAKGNKKIEGIWELSRFAVKRGFIIPGIAGKLLKYFERNFDWLEIFSYADLRWSIGNVYIQLGFELKHITQPSYYYIKGFDRIHRFNLRKRSDEPKEIPEWLLRLEEGYYRIWDCGHMKFIKRRLRNGSSYPQTC